jgi:hypothetical protein
MVATAWVICGAALAAEATVTGPATTARPRANRAARRIVAGVSQRAAPVASRPTPPGTDPSAVTTSASTTQPSTAQQTAAAARPTTSSKVAVPARTAVSAAAVALHRPMTTQPVDTVVAARSKTRRINPASSCPVLMPTFACFCLSRHCVAVKCGCLPSTGVRSPQPVRRRGRRDALAAAV